jgi:hypothetical protein
LYVELSEMVNLLVVVKGINEAMEKARDSATKQSLPK